MHQIHFACPANELFEFCPHALKDVLLLVDQVLPDLDGLHDHRRDMFGLHLFSLS
jgi:hypothetical protein